VASVVSFLLATENGQKERFSRHNNLARLSAKEATEILPVESAFVCSQGDKCRCFASPSMATNFLTPPEPSCRSGGGAARHRGRGWG